MEAATLAGGDGSGAFCHHFLGEDQSFGEHVAIGGRSGEAVKDAVDLRGAHVHLFGDSFQGEVLGQVVVDKVEQATVKIRFFLLIGGGVGLIGKVYGAQKPQQVSSQRIFGTKCLTFAAHFPEAGEGRDFGEFLRRVEVPLSQLPFEKGVEEAPFGVDLREYFGVKVQGIAFIALMTAGDELMRFRAAHEHKTAGAEVIDLTFHHIVRSAADKAVQFKIVVEVHRKASVLGFFVHRVAQDDALNPVKFYLCHSFLLFCEGWQCVFLLS